MTMMECLGRRMAALREREGWSQYVLASRAGVPHATIWRVESGRQKSISVEVVRKLARALRVDIDYLVGTYDPEVDMPCAPEQQQVGA